MVLILSTPNDDHAQAVIAELLKKNVEANLINLREFPQRLGFLTKYEGSKRKYALGCATSGIDFSKCDSVWWRRPQNPEIHGNIRQESHRHFAISECIEALQGLWQSVDVFWVNDPIKDLVAQKKIYQLRIAQEVELEIPDTLITSCIGAAREFIAPRGFQNVVYKAFSATETEWRETRILKENELDMLTRVQYAPVIFQEYIEAKADIRITIVGDDIFAAAIYSQETSYKVDFRMDMGNARVEEIQLPEIVLGKLRKYMAKLGLSYGAIDMRLTPDNRYVFLEINPAGQWLFIENRTKQPISNRVAKLLVDKI